MFAQSLPPHLGCWLIQPLNISMAYSCQMCQVSSCFCPNTASLRGRNPSLQNVCQGSPDVKQAHLSNRLSLPLDICKSMYFSVCSKSFSTEHAWSIRHVLEMSIFLSKKNYIAGDATCYSLTTVLRIPCGK